ncbi:MAG: aspartate kinase [Lactobacillus helveticus]|uniref:Aspartokinase n=2 Tax=Lactobacillus helveticus TaxID=1587 RepID=A0AAU8XUS0_LACHE|nr:aspartate kinase [Lactobacillus helveticus]ANZ55229.1 aspartate kinase [Lactobacillus helveticus]AQY53333.1 aspartate kinase [Lactobacillus helveticus]AUI74487.1 aspartate kinase [Lactobacillus helveticus]AUI76436.1 aspartate kinase [Lactobacillus helveticus]AZA20083.1 MAG: aspartate kinase [Lactobacillus helveticus]
MKVVKFGGSSLTDGQNVEQALNIVLSDPERRAIVVSAPGKRSDDDIKITDLLIKYAGMTLKSEDTNEIVQNIFMRYQEIGHYFGLSDQELKVIKDILLALPNQTYPNSSYLMAAFKAHGERLNARLIAMILQHQGVKSRFLDPTEAGLIVTGQPNDALVNPESYLNLDQIKIATGERIIFPGFFGITPSGNIATFSRGGSDITGAILARGFHADMYENFTDVNGIFAANPHIVDNPQSIKKMTYREMRELSYAGFSVFHDEALIPVIQGQIPINVKNTHEPDQPGTIIVPEKDFVPDNIITGVTSQKHFSALYLHKYLLNKEAGFTLRILQILYKHNVPYEHMPSGIDDITIIFNNDFLNDQLIDQICNEIQATINPDQLEWIDDYAIIMVVGEGMKKYHVVSRQILDSLGDHDISPRMINQGASQISMMIGTKKEKADEAVKIIYHQFFAKEENHG